MVNFHIYAGIWYFHVFIIYFYNFLLLNWARIQIQSHHQRFQNKQGLVIPFQETDLVMAVSLTPIMDTRHFPAIITIPCPLKLINFHLLVFVLREIVWATWLSVVWKEKRFCVLCVKQMFWFIRTHVQIIEYLNA